MYQPSQVALVTIGPLVCKGKTKDLMEGGSCQSLKLQGKPSGYYLLDTNNGSSVSSAVGSRSAYFFNQSNSSKQSL